MFAATVLTAGGWLGFFSALAAAAAGIAVGLYVNRKAEKKAPEAEKPKDEPEAKPEEKIEEKPEVKPEPEPKPEAKAPVEEGDVLINPDGTRVSLNKSCEARIIQMPDDVKAFYSALKNQILSYSAEGKSPVKSKISWKHEAFRIGKQTVIRFKIRGKMICVFYALDPKAYDGTKYKVTDSSKSAAFADTPCQFRVNSERKLGYAIQLADDLMQSLGYAKGELQTVDYSKEFPYEGTMSLIERGLIKTSAAGTGFIPGTDGEITE